MLSYLQEYRRYWSFTSWTKKLKMRMPMENHSFCNSGDPTFQSKNQDTGLIGGGLTKIKTLAWLEVVWQTGGSIILSRVGQCWPFGQVWLDTHPCKQRLVAPSHVACWHPSVAAFTLQGQKWGVVTETTGCAKPEISGVRSVTRPSAESYLGVWTAISVWAQGCHKEKDLIQK